MVCFFASTRRLKRVAKNKGPINDLMIVNPVEKRDRDAAPYVPDLKAAARKANARALRRISKLQARADRRGLMRNYFAGFKPITTEG